MQTLCEISLGTTTLRNSLVFWSNEGTACYAGYLRILFAFLAFVAARTHPYVTVGLYFSRLDLLLILTILSSLTTSHKHPNLSLTLKQYLAAIVWWDHSLKDIWCGLSNPYLMPKATASFISPKYSYNQWELSELSSHLLLILFSVSKIVPGYTLQNWKLENWKLCVVQLCLWCFGRCCSQKVQSDFNAWSRFGHADWQANFLLTTMIILYYHAYCIQTWLLILDNKPRNTSKFQCSDRIMAKTTLPARKHIPITSQSRYTASVLISWAWGRL